MGHNKVNNVHVMRIPEEEKRERKGKKVYLKQ